MNEWSPGRNYSRPGTPNQLGKSYRSQFEENEKMSKSAMITKPVAERNKQSNSQSSAEDVTKVLSSTTTKAKKNGSGITDPRFKRVISLGTQNDACVGTVGKTKQPSSPPAEKEFVRPTESNINTTEYKNVWQDSSENKERAKPSVVTCTEECRACENACELDPTNQESFQDDLKSVDKLKFNHDIVDKSFSKESLSDCTVNTRNTSLVSEDHTEELCRGLSMFPSATRVKKVQNWILQDQKFRPGKKHSVITVIGQTQSSALQDIDKRKKLAKELDKHAVCKKIIDAEKEMEICELVAKIKGLSSGRVTSSEDKSFGMGDSSDNLNIPKNKDGSDNLDNSDNSHSFSISKKRSFKKKKKDYLVSNEYPVKGSINDFLNRIQYQWAFCFIIFVSGILCWFTYFSFRRGTVSFDLFSSKPKPMTWYEKICTWIWELFRPSGNYRRTVS